MASESQIPLFPKAETLFIRTGNIVNWNRLKKKPSQSSTEELIDCITSTLTDWKLNADVNDIQYAGSIRCINNKFLDTLDESERELLKLTVKIFLSDCSADAVVDAINTVMSELKTDHIESVLLSFPAHSLTEDFSLDTIKPAWSALEKYVQQSVCVVGVSDLSTEQLQELYDWAEHKPTTNQINLNHCCTIPPEMHQFAKQNDIQLLTHSDSKDVLPVDEFRDVIASTCTSRDSELWQPCWTVRYSSLVKGRGVIGSKGYMTKWSRDLKRRK